MAVIPKLDEANLQAICDILGATDTGLTGSKIGQYLRECNCPTTARTLTEAEAMASALRKVLVERNVHADVLKFCRAELLVDNYFHAVFEATKSVAEKLRQKTGRLGSDGAALVDEALGIGKAGCPRLAFNSLTTESERNEHSGLMNLIKGLFGAFRNTTAHAPKFTGTLRSRTHSIF
jgi:uncharacterized protein (TIGR02391 family)